MVEMQQIIVKCIKNEVNAFGNNIRNKKNDNAVFLDGCKLINVSWAKILGITIDATFTGEPHICNVCQICSRNVDILGKVKHLLPKIS